MHFKRVNVITSCHVIDFPSSVMGKKLHFAADVELVFKSPLIPRPLKSKSYWKRTKKKEKKKEKKNVYCAKSKWIKITTGSLLHWHTKLNPRVKILKYLIQTSLTRAVKVKQFIKKCAVSNGVIIVIHFYNTSAVLQYKYTKNFNNVPR